MPLQKKFRSLFIIFLCLSGLFFFLCLGWKKTDGFRTDKIKLVPNKDCLTCRKDAFDISILDQEFVYFAKGRQSFVFESEDKKHVLKFFNNSDLFYFEKLAFLPFFKKHLMRKNKKKDEYFQGYQLAVKELDDDLIEFVHFTNKPCLNKKISVKSKYGKKLLINLDEINFIVQKKARPLPSYLADHATDGRKIRELIDSFFLFMLRRLNKNISDKDIAIWSNFGVLDGKLALIDAGRIYLNQSLQREDCFQNELKVFCKRFRRQIELHAKDSLDYFDQKYLQLFEQKIASCS